MIGFKKKRKKNLRFARADVKKGGRRGRQEAEDAFEALNSNGGGRLAGSESSWNVDLKRKGNGTRAAPI